MISIDLSNKKILITGALGAIGQFVVNRLLETGAFLFLTDIHSEEDAEKILDNWGVKRDSCRYLKMDVTNRLEVNRVVKDLFLQFPDMDQVIGHAGGCTLHPFEETTEEAFMDIFNFNFFGQTHLSRAVLKEWTSRKIEGHLMYTSSYVARFPHKFIPAYASSKAALETFVKCLALEYAHANIRFNIVSPGNVAAGGSLRVYENDEEYRSFVDRVSPLQRRNQPEAVADAYVYLCSNLANELNGHILNVDLGISIPKIG